MKKTTINPLFVSALDILTGALGAFIILNFLNSMQPIGTGTIPEKQIVGQQADKKATTDGKKYDKPPTAYTGWWRKPPAEDRKGQYENNGTVQQPQTQEKPEVKPQPVQPPTPPQDPVTVDLMKQTQGAVVILLQQPDKSKTAVEMMIRQGNRTWKPARASKYQDNTFAYQKGLNYYYQSDIQPGTYEVLIRVKKGAKSSGQEVFNLYGKLVPSGGKAITYNFGTYGIAQKDWISAGTFIVANQGLQFNSRLVKADPNVQPEPVTPAQPTVVQSAPKKKGKWD